MLLKLPILLNMLAHGDSHIKCIEFDNYFVDTPPSFLTPSFAMLWAILDVDRQLAAAR